MVHGLEFGDMGTGLSELQQEILAGKSPEQLTKKAMGGLLGRLTGPTKRRKSKKRTSGSKPRKTKKGSYKNIRIKKPGGGTRLQRVKVLASGKYKFVKNK